MVKRFNFTTRLALFLPALLLLPFALILTAPDSVDHEAEPGLEQSLSDQDGHGLEEADFYSYAYEEEVSQYSNPSITVSVEEEETSLPPLELSAQEPSAPATGEQQQASPPATQEQAGQPPVEPQLQADQQNSASASGASAKEQEMLRLINEARAGSGLPALQLCGELQRAARFKSKDMADNNYFSHQSPTYSGGLPGLLSRFGISYRAAGENLAWNTNGSVSGAHNSLMNSPGHRANIMGSFTHVGVGVAVKSDGSHYFTQLYVSR